MTQRIRFIPLGLAFIVGMFVGVLACDSVHFQLGFATIPRVGNRFLFPRIRGGLGFGSEVPTRSWLGPATPKGKGEWLAEAK